MSMIEARLVFSKPRSSDSWHASSIADERTFYVCEREGDGWLAKVVHRRDDQSLAPPGRLLVERTDLGWQLKLIEAKGLCNAHHCLAILDGDDENLKAYVRRWTP